MADYRKRLVDMTEEERAEVAPGSPQFSGDYENVDDPLSVQMMEAGLDFTPLGIVKGVSDIKDELSKDDPNYLKALGMSAVEAAGIIPGAAPVLKGMVKGSFKTSKGINKQVSNTEYDARMADLDEAPDADTWQKSTKKFVKESRDVNPTVRTPELESSTMDLIDGKITREQHLNNVDKFKPVDPWDALPREPSDKATVFSLKPNQRKDGFFVLPEAEANRLGVVKSALAIGQRFLGRLDIPAYKDYDTWIVAGKSPKGEKGTVYAKAIHYGSADGKPVVFRASQGKSEKIGKGKADPEYTPETHEKTGYATVDGIVQDLDVDSIRAKAAQYLNDPEWVQVGFDPRRQGGFYVRAGENKHVPIREASEVIQIGPLVLARNAKLDFEHTGYAEGGAVMNNRDNQMEMLFDEGGISDDGMNVDPVSGNEIPPGSMASEVRDDIPAQLSEGEYVVPADVLRFYGVKFFEDLRSEAKQGMAQMEADGRIGGEPVGMEDPRDAESALTPEEMAVLQEMGMAVGGMVPQPTQSTDPYMQQQNMYQQPSPVAMGNTGYNEGGLEDGVTPMPGITPIPDNAVPDNTQSTFDPSMYNAGFSFLSPSTPTETTPTPSTVMLYSPDGLTTQSFTLPAQQTEYDAKLAAGWSTTQVQMPQVTTQAGDDDDPPIKPDTGEQGKKFSEMSGEELQNALNQNKKASAIMKGLVAVNPMLGLAGLGATKYAEKQILENMKNLGVEPVESDDPTVIEEMADWIGSKFGTGKDKKTVAQQTAKDNKIKADSVLKDMQKDDDDDSNLFPVTAVSIDTDPSGSTTQSMTYGTGDDEFTVTADEDGLNKGGLMIPKKKKK